MNSVTTPYEEAISEPVFTAPEMGDPYAAITGGLNAYTPPDSLEGSPFVPAQSTYPSLFRPDAERRPFFATYRWWEDEASTVLWAFDAQEIQRVIRYGLFPNEDLPRAALQSRNQGTVDSFLLKLAGPYQRPFIANLSHAQKVEDILRRSKSACPSFIPWSWLPSPLSCDQDPRSIALEIDAESRLHFIRIPFEEWVRYSLGYQAASVDWFLQQHTAFHIHLLIYLRAFPEEIKRYSEVEKHLQGRSPFAHRALVRCMLTVQGNGAQEPPLSPVPGFDFITGSIQRLFKEHPPSLGDILKVLCVLEVRFRRTYVHAPKMNWKKYFDTGIAFLADVLASTSAEDLAGTLTSIDENRFSGLNQQNAMPESPAVWHINTEWNSLSMAVWEVCSALPELIGYIQECVQALFLTRNYHSLTATLHGLQKYSILAMSITNINSTTGTATLSPVLPADSFYLLDPFQNYLAYRRQFHQAPGIPFLPPHIREFKWHDKGALHQFFQAIHAPLS